MTGRCVGDLVHLLPELIENATSFSPPQTKVRMAGESAARGYVIEIEDGGIGMTDAHDAGLYLKRARTAEALYGGASFHRDRYAALLGF